MIYCSIVLASSADQLQYVYFVSLLFLLIPFSCFIVFQLFQLAKIEICCSKIKFDNSVALHDTDELFDLLSGLIKKCLWLDAVNLMEQNYTLPGLDACQYFNALGFVYYKMEAYNLAKSYYIEALSIKEDYIVALQNLAEVYDVLKDRKLAFSTYEYILRHDPCNSSAMKYLSRKSEYEY